MADKEILASGRAFKAARKGAVKNGSEVRSDGTLDAGIWGRLQKHIPLRKVHEKLPCEDFFMLRIVSKAWNQVALERLERKPYFVTLASGPHCRYLNGILSHDVASGTFSWKPQYHIEDTEHQADTFFALFEVEGLIFSPDPNKWRDQVVFNLHAKT